MAYEVFIGQYLPNTNKRCQVTGKLVGPNHPQKFAYAVQYRGEGKFGAYTVADRVSAEKLRDQILEKEKDKDKDKDNDET